MSILRTPPWRLLSLFTAILLTKSFIDWQVNCQWKWLLILFIAAPVWNGRVYVKVAFPLIYDANRHDAGWWATGPRSWNTQSFQKRHRNINPLNRLLWPSRNVAVSVSTESSPSACIFQFYSASRDTGSTANKNVHAYASKSKLREWQINKTLTNAKRRKFVPKQKRGSAFNFAARDAAGGTLGREPATAVTRHAFLVSLSQREDGPTGNVEFLSDGFCFGGMLPLLCWTQYGYKIVFGARFNHQNALEDHFQQSKSKILSNKIDINLANKSDFIWWKPLNLLSEILLFYSVFWYIYKVSHSTFVLI